MHETLSPYNSRLNSLAKVNNCIIQQLILKTKDESFNEKFAALKNTKCHNKLAPNTLFFKQNLHTYIYSILSEKQPLSKNPEHNTIQDCLRPLPIGSRVHIQDSDGRWISKGHIESVNEQGRTYDIILDDGRRFRRNWKFIRKCYI